MGKKTNITLIGMPASGKSSVGVVLAKRLGKKFVDTDIVIQEIEDEVNATLDVSNSIISPGGSVVYGERAMKHLKEISVIIYLELSYTAIKSRLGDLRERGITLKDGQTLKDLYLERTPLYKKYADITINEMKKSLSKTIDEICESLGEKPRKKRNFKSKKIKKESGGKEKSKNSQKIYKDNKNNVQRKSVKKYFKKNEN